MEVSSLHQLYVFLLSVMSGIGCGVFFDFQRSLRRLRFAGSIRTTIEDIIFVLFAMGAAISLGFFFNNGQMRYYQVLGGVSGALFYAAFLSSKVMKLLGAVFAIFEKIIVKPIVKLIKILIVPVRRMSLLVKTGWKKMKRKKKKVARSIRKRKNCLKKRIKML